MLRIEAALATYEGYLILFVDEVDHLRRDKDTFMAFLDHAASEIEQDKYITMIRTAPRQLQAAMAAVIQCVHSKSCEKGDTGEVYQIYNTFCSRVALRPLTRRAFGDMFNELDMYSLLRSHVISRGRYGRKREISIDLP